MAGGIVTDAALSAITFIVRETDAPLKVAVRVTGPCDVAVPAIPVMTAEFAPPGMVKVAGTGASVGSDVLSETMTPSGGAAWFSATWEVNGWPPRVSRPGM